MSFLRRTAVAAFSCFLSFVPVFGHAAGDEPIAVSATDQMKFDTTDITGKVGQKLTLKLVNEGSMPKEAMAHNIVILKPGTDVSAFMAAAYQHEADDYLPDGSQAERMIAHTKLLGPGEEDTVSFTPPAAGVYEYVCTFPGHLAAGMRGKITVQ